MEIARSEPLTFSDSPHQPILITGGAGYVGSHVALALLDAGWPVVVVDDLSNGRRELVPDAAEFIEGSAGDTAFIARTLKDVGCRSVMHFAGDIINAESVREPMAYYLRNTVVSEKFISACRAARVAHFIFSSSAAVYGEPAKIPVNEDTPTVPITPYGTSKLMTEWMLRRATVAGNMRYVALRYFNVAGADPKGRSGQCSQVTTHLIKAALEVALGRQHTLNIYGDDYPTPDGTCIRDYIHVSDLAEAHVLALQNLLSGGANQVLNCGYGHGFSVREIINAVSRACGNSVPTTIAARRPGDVARLVADGRRLKDLLGWTPRYEDIETIIASAYAWEKSPFFPATDSTETI
jgi:UDP-glucose 4-epimerase